MIRGGQRFATPARALLVLAALIFGARAEAQRQPGWDVRVVERIELVSGAAGAIAISIAVDRGLTISKDAAVIVDLVAPPGVTLRKRRIGRGDAVDPEADAPRFAVPIRAGEPGEYIVKIRVRFWLCGGRSCRPIDVRRAATVVVAAAPPPPTSDAAVDADAMR